MKMILTIGVSASGKTTWAKEFVEKPENKNKWININRDDIRFKVLEPNANHSTYKYTKEKEKQVTELAKEMFLQCVKANLNVIISDTNLKKNYRDLWVELANNHDYEVEFKEFDISLEDAWKRDTLRENGVGHTVIYKQYQDWEVYKNVKKYKPDPKKQKCIIVDIDGTIALNHDRYIHDYTKVLTDTPRKFVIDLIKSYQYIHDCHIIYLSGRNESALKDTTLWIMEHTNQKISDKCSVILCGNTANKRSVFWDKIAPNYNVIACFDDLPKSVRIWHSLGIQNVISVANQLIEV